MTTKFRRKPVEVEAVQYAGHGNMHPRYMGSLPDWIWAAFESGTLRAGAGGVLLIKTLEGDTTAAAGDWIINCVKNGLHSCKPDAFAQTYEPAD